jgi:uncharacterized membrane protein
VIREEAARLMSWEDRHARLIARVSIAIILTFAVAFVGATLMLVFERNKPGSEIHSYWDAFYFSTVQVLTVSSQMRNPVTTAGRIVDIALELWAIIVVTAVAGSFATFFSSGDPDA